MPQPTSCLKRAKPAKCPQPGAAPSWEGTAAWQGQGTASLTPPAPAPASPGFLPAAPRGAAHNDSGQRKGWEREETWERRRRLLKIDQIRARDGAGSPAAGAAEATLISRLSQELLSHPSPLAALLGHCCRGAHSPRAQHPAWVLGPSSPWGAVLRQGTVPSLPFWVQMSSELPREFLETQTGCVRAASRPHGVTRPELALLPPGTALLRALPSGHCLLIDAWKQTQRGHVPAAGLGTRCS